MREGRPFVSTYLVIAVLFAVTLSTFAVVLVGFDDGNGTAVRAGSTGQPPAAVHVSLTEFAITPKEIEVPVGGSLHVANDGTVAHNLTIADTGLATVELPAGESGEIDLSELEAGEYKVLCTIPGHESAGMSATLTISTDAPAAASTGEATSGHGPHMTEADYQRMDQAMMDSMLAYPAATEGVGNQVLVPTILPDGTKQFDLTAKVTPWEVEPGKKVDAWTYNGMVPAPQIRVNVGDHVQIVVHNELPMGTDLHLHGINVPNSMDGVAPLTQPLIEPGQSFTYDFVTDEVAVAMYHAHHHGQLQVPNGMFGTIFVGELPLPAGRTVGGEAVPADLHVSQELPMVLNDSGVIGYSLNGKGFPATAPITGKVGDWLLIHYFNEGSQIHPMHLHQFDQIVVAKDGFPLDHPYVADTLDVAPGERYSVLVKLESPGTWVWHCHILNHVERETGMFGMVTAVVVQ